MTLKKSQSSDPEADTLVLGLGTDTVAKGQSVPVSEPLLDCKEVAGERLLASLRTNHFQRYISIPHGPQETL